MCVCVCVGGMSILSLSPESRPRKTQSPQLSEDEERQWKHCIFPGSSVCFNLAELCPDPCQPSSCSPQAFTSLSPLPVTFFLCFFSAQSSGPISFGKPFLCPQDCVSHSLLCLHPGMFTCWSTSPCHEGLENRAQVFLFISSI